MGLIKPTVGFESTTTGLQKPENGASKPFTAKVPTKNEKSDLAPYLASIVEKYPELVELIKAWPILSSEEKRIIFKIV